MTSVTGWRAGAPKGALAFFVDWPNAEGPVLLARIADHPRTEWCDLAAGAQSCDGVQLGQEPGSLCRRQGVLAVGEPVGRVLASRPRFQPYAEPRIAIGLDDVQERGARNVFLMPAADRRGDPRQQGPAGIIPATDLRTGSGAPTERGQARDPGPVVRRRASPERVRQFLPGIAGALA
jgi:hypothetical protein